MDEMYGLLADALTACEGNMEDSPWESAEAQTEDGGYVLVMLSGEPVKIKMERL